MIRQQHKIIDFGHSTPKVVLRRSYVLKNCLNGEVVIPNGFTDIEVSAFKEMKQITRIVLPKTLRHIDERAFYGCENLREVVMFNGIEIIGAEAFQGCQALEKIDLPSNLTVLAKDTFKNCTHLKAVTGMKHMRRIEDNAFWNCRRLTEVEMPQGEVEIGMAVFYRCESLEKITLPHLLKRIKSHCFDGAGLKDLFLPEGLETIDDGALLYCEQLKRLVIPKSLSKIGHFAFAGCINLTKIVCQSDIPIFGEAAFPSNARVVCRWSHESQLRMEARGFHLYQKKDMLALFTHEQPEPAVLGVEKYPKDALRFIFGVKEIETRAYCGRENIQKAIIGEGVESIEAKAFAGCRGLREVVFPKSLKIIKEGAFQGCPLRQITIPEKVECVERFSFRDTKALKRVDFLGKANLNNQAFASSGVKRLYLHQGMVLKPFLMQAVTLLCLPAQKEMRNFLKSIGYQEKKEAEWYAYHIAHYKQIDAAFVPVRSISGKVEHAEKNVEDFQYANQAQLQSITITEGTKTIGVGAFFNCSALEKVKLPKSIKHLDHSCFSNCLALKKIEIPEGITVLPARAFRDCKNLESVVLPDSVKLIEQGCFQNCEKLSKIRWSKGLLRINEYAFYGCKKLEPFCLPPEVSIIEKNAFTNCKKIKSVKTGAHIAYFSPASFALRTVLNCPADSETLKMAQEAGLRTAVITPCTKIKEA
ncbi:leucine-rich repeat domain-containing protein [Eubacterium sp.]|uniref:leucine-rich repeat domain-containing protein n=1 Tax=Eubacterium sp. TaxID=142586 RepID=UPI0026E0168E|nr:leucine-rich repeat domain-containing protein [Eubacterium sp.]MDO5433601.1 leucine-rich repeat domain-containing protein [Eubacterium sp.]